MLTKEQHYEFMVSFLENIVKCAIKNDTDFWKACKEAAKNLNYKEE